MGVINEFGVPYLVQCAPFGGVKVRARAAMITKQNQATKKPKLSDDPVK